MSAWAGDAKWKGQDDATTVISGGGGGITTEANGSILVTRSGASGAGSTTSTAAAPAGARFNRVYLKVETAFDAGATGKVGFSDVDNSLVTVTDLDATFLSTLGAERDLWMDVAATGTRKLKVTSVGASTVGSLRVIGFYDTPGT